MARTPASLRLVQGLAVALVAFAPAAARAAIGLAGIHDGAGNGAGYPAGIPLPDRTLVLTIDDGPLGLNPELAQFLHARGIRAAFFVNGIRADEHADGPLQSLAEIAELGHQLANHTETHFRLPDDPSRAPEEVRLTFRRLSRYLSNGLHAFRPPFAAWNASVYAALATPEFAYTAGPFGHEINGNDWSCLDRARTPQQCASDFVSIALARPQQNGIIVMHEHVKNADPTYHRVFAEALLDQLAAVPGTPFTFVALDAIPGVAGGLTAGPATPWSAEFADAGPLGGAAASESLRAGDLDADGDDDVCARSAEGVWCASSDGVALGPATLWSLTFSDANGYAESAYGATLALADVDGDGRADLCVRAPTGLVCETSDGVDGFAPSAWSSADFSDAAGFGADESRWRSLRMGDVDGDGRADACARDGAGVVCALALASGFAPATVWSAAFDDASGFGDPAYGATLALGDVSGDGRADVCARAATGVLCARSTGAGFEPPSLWIDNVMSDAEGWTARSRFLALRLADVNGDALADLCGRNATGVECVVSTGTELANPHYAVNTSFLDAQGYGVEARAQTFFVGRLAGAATASLCARAPGGIVCHRAQRDPDRDGVADGRDNCPAKWNPGQADANGNGVGDACQSSQGSCGVGVELALALPLLAAIARRRSPGT